MPRGEFAYKVSELLICSCIKRFILRSHSREKYSSKSKYYERERSRSRSKERRRNYEDEARSSRRY